MRLTYFVPAFAVANIRCLARPIRPAKFPRALRPPRTGRKLSAKSFEIDTRPATAFHLTSEDAHPPPLFSLGCGDLPQLYNSWL